MKEIKMRRSPAEHWPMAVLLAGLMLASAPICGAASSVPDLINYQGRVYLEDGSSDVTGTYDIEFRMYDQPSGTNAPLWAEKHSKVQVARGIFNVMLGSGAELSDAPHGSLTDIFKSDAIYIEMKVGNNEPIRIRQQFSAATCAFRAENAVKATHGVPPGTVMPFGGIQAPYGWLPCDGASHSKSEYPALYKALRDDQAGTCIWGEDAETFNLPNFGGRTLVGSDSTWTLTARRGEESHALATNELPLHTHSYEDWFRSTEYDLSCDYIDHFIVQQPGGRVIQDNSSSAGSGQAHNEMQPSAIVKYIIKW